MTRHGLNPRPSDRGARQAFSVPDLSAPALTQVTDAVAATAAQYDRTGEIPVKALEAVHQAGLLAATVGARYGGPGPGGNAVVKILTAVGEGDASVALLVGNTLHAHSGQAQRGFWPPAYYDDFLRRLHDGPALANPIRVERELGAPARGGLPKTTATRTDSGWVLNGHKAYATGGTALPYHLVWVTAVEEDHQDRPPDRPSHRHGGPAGHHLGADVGPSRPARLEHARRDLRRRAAPARRIRGDPARAGRVYLDPAAMTRSAGVGNTALYVGVARAARTAFVQFARDRVPSAFGKPIAQTERIQAVAGEIDLLISQAETLLHGALLRVESGDESVVPELSNIKVAIGRSVIAATQAAVAALGNPGLTRHNSLERYLRDALCVRVHPPQEDTVLLTSGRRVFGV